MCEHNIHSINFIKQFFFAEKYWKTFVTFEIPGVRFKIQGVYIVVQMKNIPEIIFSKRFS